MFLYNMKDPTCSVMLFPPSKRCISLCGIGASCGAAVSAATADALSGQWLHPAQQAKRAALPMGARKAGQTGGGVWGGPGGEASAGPDSWAPSGASHRIVLQKFRRTKCNYNFKIACMNIMNKNIKLNFLKLN